MAEEAVQLAKFEELVVDVRWRNGESLTFLGLVCIYNDVRDDSEIEGVEVPVPEVCRPWPAADAGNVNVTVLRI